MLGNYNSLLPKKYQKKTTAGGKRRKAAKPRHAGGGKKRHAPQSATALARHKARMHRLRAWL